MRSLHKEIEYEDHRGVSCLNCGSVIFDVGKLLLHMQSDPHCRYFKSNDDVVLNIAYLSEVDRGAVGHYGYLREREAEARREGECCGR